jgi:GNAT superfamily N-acetyltransferase
MVTDRVEVYLRNAVAMWTALVPGAHLDRGLLRVERPIDTRVILREPAGGEVLAGIGRLSPATSVVLEDVFAGPDPAPLTPDSRVLRMPVMNRPAGAVDLPRATARVIEVDDPETLAEAEHVMVDGYPVPRFQPWVRGEALPPRVLGLPGWRIWLAYQGDAPAAAVYTYDDGRATGVYGLATLPEHRSRGLARALLTAAITARPEHEFTLVATEAGRPLYESLGFAAVATATWHTRPPVAGRPPE